MDSSKRPVNGLANSGTQSPSTLNVPLSRLSRGFSIRSLDSIPSAQLSSISERITHPESSTSPRITEPPPVVDNSFPHVSFLAAEGSEHTTKPPEPQPSIPAVVSPEYTTESNATKLADALKKHDEDRVNHCKEDIDTLLVFAGLFSAVLSAFVVDSYKMLQDDPANVSAQILATISQQLVTISQGSSQPVTSPPTVPVFKAPIVSVRVNALWFTALVFSLVTASLAIFVKQWLREYLSLGCTSPEERLRVRHVRYKGLIRWRVFEIAAILPFLLQISLLLFFVGLSQFLWPLNIAVWAATTAFIIIWAILYLTTVFAPAFSSTCPYKTPVLSPILHYARQIFAQLRHGPSWKRGYNQMLAYYRFPGDERGIRRDEKLDIPALISADEALADDGQLVDIIKPCILNARGSEVIYVAREILSHRLDCNIEYLGLSFKEGLELSKIPARVLNVVVDSLCNAVLYSGYSPMTQMDIIEALEGLWTLADHIYFARRAVDLQFLIRTLSATPMYPNYLRIVLSIASAHWFPLRMTWDDVPEPAITSFATDVVRNTGELLDNHSNYNVLRSFGHMVALIVEMPVDALRIARSEFNIFKPDLTYKLENELSPRRSSSAFQDFTIEESQARSYFVDLLFTTIQQINDKVPDFIDDTLFKLVEQSKTSFQNAVPSFSAQSPPPPQHSEGHVFARGPNRGVPSPQSDRSYSLPQVTAQQVGLPAAAGPLPIPVAPYIVGEQQDGYYIPPPDMHPLSPPPQISHYGNDTFIPVSRSVTTPTDFQPRGSSLIGVANTSGRDSPSLRRSTIGSSGNVKPERPNRLSKASHNASRRGSPFLGASTASLPSVNEKIPL